MKVIYNSLIPFPGFVGINLFGVLFVRFEYQGLPISRTLINHESIHTAQMKELGYIGFYILYLIEFLVRFLGSGFKLKKAYREISFEKEAYQNQGNPEYLKTRKRYSWIKM